MRNRLQTVRSLIVLAVLASWVHCGTRKAQLTDALSDATPSERGSCIACPTAPNSCQEIATTPRSDVNLELLAGRLSTGIIADQQTYDRLVLDMAAIRNLKPEIAHVKHHLVHDGKTLLFSVDVPTLELMRAGQYTPWACLNAAYHVERVEATIVSSLPPSNPHHEVTLTLKGIYALDRLAAEYQRVLSIGTVGPGGAAHGDGPTICVTRRDPVWHYVISDARGDCPAGCYATTAYYFTTTPGTPPNSQGRWNSETDGPNPDWWLEFGRPAGDKAACPRPQ